MLLDARLAILGFGAEDPMFGAETRVIGSVLNVAWS